MIGNTVQAKENALKRLKECNEVDILKRLMLSEDNDNTKFTNELLNKTQKSEIVYIVTNNKSQLQVKTGTDKEITDIFFGNEYAFKYDTMNGNIKRLA